MQDIPPSTSHLGIARAAPFADTPKSLGRPDELLPQACRGATNEQAAWSKSELATWLKGGHQIFGVEIRIWGATTAQNSGTTNSNMMRQDSESRNHESQSRTICCSQAAFSFFLTL